MRTKQPLIHLSLFRNSAYSITGVVAVTGMFAFLAVCFSTSVAVGGLALAEAWKVGVLFVFIQGPAFAFIPVVGWLIHHVAPRWVLTAGFAFMALSAYWLSTFSLGTPEAFGGTPWTAFIPPLLMLGIGFALTVGSITAVAINTVQPQHIGMASATTNLLRDLGFALGPVIGSAIAFGIGATVFAGPLAGILGGAGLPAEAVAGLSNVPPLGYLSGWDGVIAQFSGQATASGAPAQAVDGMVNALTSAKQQIQGVAGTSLGQGFQTVYLAAGIAATLSAVLTLFISARSSAPTPDATAEDHSKPTPRPPSETDGPRLQLILTPLILHKENTVTAPIESDIDIWDDEHPCRPVPHLCRAPRAGRRGPPAQERPVRPDALRHHPRRPR